MTTKPSGLKTPSKIMPSQPLGSKTITSEVGDKAKSLSKDDFLIGDKVLVGGTKPGRVLFLGETQFASGMWAGVVLDKPLGKNDGSIAGIRYFQCEPLHGVFSRPTKLVKADDFSKTSSSKPKPESKVATTRTTSSSSSVSRPSALTEANVRAAGIGATDRSKHSGLRSPASSLRSFKLGGVSHSRPATDVKLGDRVVVGDTKKGVVQFVGPTQFAKGNWVGIELDEPLGKNDGSVSDTRYFSCAVNHGLFALAHKVQKIGATSKGQVKGVTTKRSTVRSPASSAVSVSSLSSMSSASKRVPGKVHGEVSSRYKQKTTSMGVEALKEALQEKQQHVESLLAERDMERNEMVEVNIAVAKKQTQLVKMQEMHEGNMREKEEQLDLLRSLMEQADQEKVRLFQDLEDEKKKVEDLQFQLEEEKISHDDMETDLSQFKDKVKELEASLHIEQQKSSYLHTTLETTRASTVDDKSELQSLQLEREENLRKISQLTLQLSAAQSTASDQVGDRELDLQRHELEGNKTDVLSMQNSIAQFKEEIATLQESLKNKNILDERVAELEEEVKQSHSKEESKEKIIDQLKDEIETLQKSLKNTIELDSRVLELEQQVSKSCLIEESQQETIHQLEDEVETLRQSVKNKIGLDARVLELEQEVSKYSSMEEIRHKTIEQLKDENETLRKSLKTNLDERVVELEGKLEKSCSTEENQQKIIDQLKDEVETLEKKLKVSSNQSCEAEQAIQQQLNEVKLHHKRSQQQVIDLNKQLFDLQDTSRKEILSQEKAILEHLQQIKYHKEELQQAKGTNVTLNLEIEALNRSLNLAAEEKSSLQKNLEDGQTRLGCVEEEKNELLLQLQEFKEQLEKAAIKCNERSSEIESLQDQLNGVTASLNSANTRCGELEISCKKKDEDIETLQNANDQNDASTGDLKNEIVALEAKLCENEQHLYVIESKYQALQAECETLTEKKLELESKSLELDSTNQSLSLHLKESIKSGTTLTAQISDLNKLNDNLRDELQQMKISNSSLMEKIALDKSNLGAEVENLLQEKQELSTSMESMQLEIQKLKDITDSKSSQLDVLQNSYDATTSQLQEKVKKCSELASLIEALEQDCSVKQQQLDTALSSQGDSLVRIQTLQDEKQHVSLTLNDLKLKNSQQEDANLQLTDQLTTANVQLKEMQVKLSKVISELSELKTDHDDARMQLADTKSSLSELNIAKQQLEGEVDASNKLCNSLKNELEQLKVSNSSLMEKIALDKSNLGAEVENLLQEKQELSAKCLHQNTSIESMQLEIQKLKDVAESKSSQLDVLQNSYDATTSQLQEKVKKCSELASLIEALEQDCSVKQQQLDTVLASHGDSLVQIQTLQDEKQHVSLTLNDLKLKNGQQEDANLQLTDQLTTANVQLKEMQVKLSKVISELSELKTDHDDARMQLADTKSSLSELNIAKQQLEGEVDASNKLCNSLKNELEQLKVSNSSLMEKIALDKSNLGAEVENLLQEKQELSAKCLHQNTSIKSMQLEIQKLKDVAESKSSQLDVLQNSCDATTSQLQEKVKKCSELASLIEALEQDCSVKQQQLDTVLASHGDSLVQIQTLQDEKQHVSLTLNDLKLKNGQQEDVNLQLTDQLTTANVQLEEMRVKLSKLESELSELKTDHDNVKTQLADTKSSLSELNNTKQQLEGNVEELKKKCSSASEELCSYKLSVEDVRASKTGLEDELEHQRLSFIAVEAELSILRKEKDELEEKATQLEASRVHAEKQLSQLTCQLDSEKLRVASSINDMSQMKNTLDQICSERDALQSEIESFKKNFEVEMIKMKEQANVETKDKDDRLETLFKKSNEEKTRLQTQIDQLTAQCEQAELARNQLTNELADEKNKFQVEVESLQSSCNEKILETQSKIEAKERANAVTEQTQLQLEIEHLKKELASNLQKCDCYEAELSETRQQKNEIEEQRLALQSQLDQSTRDIENLKQKCIDLEREFKQQTSNLTLNAADIANAQQDIHSLSKQRDALQSKLDKMEKREKILKKEFDHERESLQKSLDIATSLVEAKSKELQVCQEEVSCFKNQQLVTQSLRDRVSALENENKVFHDRLAIDYNTDPTQNNSDNQVDFLNKVIVDQQSKIEGLNAKIKDLEDMMNGDVYEEEEPVERENSSRAPRLFCDICDVFDAHDTEDCPTQSMGNPNNDHGSVQHYERGEERPYCDDCEEFGHWTQDCEVDEMF